MNDDIVPGYTTYITSKTDADGWERNVFTDEVYWYKETGEYGKQYYRIAQWPFVPGYFLCKLMTGSTHYPVTQAFRTLKAAKVAAMVLGMQDDAEIEVRSS